MDFIKSKNIFLITRDTLKLLDKRMMKHGSRVAYILYKMLQTKGGYEKFEMAEYAMLATLHDIGAYRTSDLAMPLSFETRNTLPHSIYGYLFLKHLSPFQERAKILLNHHISFMELAEKGEKNYLEVTTYLSLAECVDVYREALGDRFQVSSFRPFEGKRFSRDALNILDKVLLKEDLFARIESEEYEKELDALMDTLIFTNEEKKMYMETMMFCLDFRSHMKVMDTAVCISICSQLAQIMHLDQKTQEFLYYGALIHDIGMLAIPKDIIESNRRLTDEEIEMMREHVSIAKAIYTSKMDQAVIDIAIRHHERCNGSGYPEGLQDKDMNTPQKILQLADALTGMINDRPHRPGMSYEKVRAILEKEAGDRNFDPEILRVFFNNFDQILDEAKLQGRESLKANSLVEARYVKLEQALEKMKKK